MASRLLEDLRLSLHTLSKAVLSQRTDAGSAEKVIIRPVLMRSQRLYQVESFSDNKAYHKNLSEEELSLLFAAELDGKYRQAMISSSELSAQYSLNSKGGYKRKLLTPLPQPGAALSHNREKSYILSEGENIPALVDLGVFTPDFRIIRSKYDKYKQINRFIELIDHEFSKTGRKEITILDFGCGKSYLTFIIYYYFTVKKGMKAKIIGYDLKDDVVRNCQAVAEKYGYEGLSFVRADVTRDVLYDEHIDMIVTLHACDTATDYALYYALKKKAEFIFSVPCCQHEVNLSALLTDSIRAGILEDMGYKVDMIEFIDFEHSPKNIMIRARRGGSGGKSNILRARALADTYGFEQSLLRLVEQQL